ncbi:hypothetical protein Pint_01773 [Pistacia integerrima]|uniref:Uncharacterized protein n=1 Tax=Pistacia integerrima TaxID=434235 RepID=A0ACC0ZJU3_9ROSI|nr:hypothetical protein Pint_01773 [Pistacia integerrima]
MRHSYMFLVFTVVLCLISSQFCEAGRVLTDEEDELKKGPVRGVGSNGCTYIPESGETPCYNNRNFAGSRARAPPQYSNLMGAAISGK